MSRSISRKGSASKAKSSTQNTTTTASTNSYPFPVPKVILETMEQVIGDECKTDDKKLWCMTRGPEVGYTVDGDTPLALCVFRALLAELRGILREIAEHKLPKLSMESWHGVDMLMTIHVAMTYANAMIGALQEAGVTYEYDPVVQRAVGVAMAVNGTDTPVQ